MWTKLHLGVPHSVGNGVVWLFDEPALLFTVCQLKVYKVAVAWWLFTGWVGNIDYGAPPPPPPTYSGNEKHAVQTFTTGGGGQSVYGGGGGGGGSPLQVRYLCLAHVIINTERLQFNFDRGGCSSTRSPPPPMDTPLLSYPHQLSA